MDIKQQLIISYSGSLDAKKSNTTNSILNFFKNLFWTYKHDTVNSSTRTAFYLIKGVGILKRDFKITPSELQIKLWGNIHPLNLQQCKDEDVSEFFVFDDYLPKDESLKRLNESDMLFLPLEKSNVQGQGTLFIPGKLFEYLNTSKPILALCENSDCKEIIENSGLGFCIEPDNPELIAKNLFPLIKNKNLLLALKPNKDYIEKFSFKNKTLELIEVLKKANVERN